MFARARSGRSGGGASRSGSLREIAEEQQAAAAAQLQSGEEKVYVAVGKDVKDGNANLLWAATNLPAARRGLILFHVHQPADRILMGFSKLPASQIEEKKLRAERQREREEMNSMLNQYLKYCTESLKLQAEKMVIEKSNAASGILELIAQHRITELVMGASAISTKKQAPRSKVAAIVHQQANLCCTVHFIYREALACTREASCVSDLPYHRSMSLPEGHPASQDQAPVPHRSYSVNSISPASGEKDAMQGPVRRSVDMTQTSCSPNSSHLSTGGSSSSLKDLDKTGSPASGSRHPPEQDQPLLEETEVGNDVYERLQQALYEAERSKSEAYEESCRRQKAERELFEASMKFKQLQKSLRNEKMEMEERLTRERTDVENERLRVQKELQKANKQKEELEKKLLQANSLVQDLQQLQAQMRLERDKAVREAEEMRPVNGNAAAVALTEFTYEELIEATNNFDGSEKIGQGGSGSVYKGFLRHTTVAIKKFDHEGIRGDKEFNDEVGILSRMRHPNLVTLMGVCREARALVYEFLPNGSLEDCLQCKKNKPLPWRARVRIAYEVCSALMYLHSSKPKSIAHGDLKPGNVLLDANYLSKLGDFGTSRFLNHTNTTVTPYHRTNEPKGTFGYMDPSYIACGELTAHFDVYSFGVVLLRLLTGKDPLRVQNEVEAALSKGILHEVLDASAGEWPPEQARELADLGLRCCRLNRKERPDLAKEVWGVLKAMANAPPPSSSKPPSYFICPITEDIMRDPYIAADGFTYEGEAIKDWLERGHESSPMTYGPLPHRELIPNSALRFAIDEWRTSRQGQ